MEKEEMINALKEEGYIVRPEDEDNQFRENLRNTLLEQERPKIESELQDQFKKSWRERMEAIETPLKDLGFEKAKNEEGKPETADQFAVRVAKELKEKLGKLQNEKGDDFFKNQIKTLENTVKAYSEKVEEEREKTKAEMTDRYANNLVRRALDNLPYKPDLEDDAKEAVKQVAMAQIKSLYSKLDFDDNYKERLYDENGNLLTDDKGNPQTISNLLRTINTLQPFLSQGNAHKGTGAQNGQKKGSVSFPSNAKSKYDFDQAIKEMNLSPEKEKEIRTNPEARDFYLQLPLT